MSSIRIDTNPKFKVGDLVVHDITGVHTVEGRYWSDAGWSYDVGPTRALECFLKMAPTNTTLYDESLLVKNE